MFREKTDLKMERAGGYRRSAVWRSCGVTPHAALQSKSVVSSGSRVTISTVMKLHGSDNRGVINVKTYTKSTCTQLISSSSSSSLFQYDWLTFSFFLNRDRTVTSVQFPLSTSCIDACAFSQQTIRLLHGGVTDRLIDDDVHSVT